VQFAQQHGYEFISSSDESIRVNRNIKQDDSWQFAQDLQFKVLRKMEFNSDRKRMSMVVLDHQDGFYKLFCKGADNVIKERLLEGQDTRRTERFLQESAQ
jgi:phospholipid-transporting ATPase